MKEIEYILPKSVEDLAGQHFIIYNPDHQRKNDWHYEYNSLQEAVNDGYTFEELLKYVNNGYVRICLEVSEVEE